MGYGDQRDLRIAVDTAQKWPRFIGVRAPDVAEPERRQHMQRGGRGPAIDRGDAQEHVLGRRFGVLDKDVEIAIVVEDARVQQLVLRLVTRTPAVRLYEVAVRKWSLR